MLAGIIQFTVAVLWQPLKAKSVAARRGRIEAHLLAGLTEIAHIPDLVSASLNSRVGVEQSSDRDCRIDNVDCGHCREGLGHGIVGHEIDGHRADGRWPRCVLPCERPRRVSAAA